MKKELKTHYNKENKMWYAHRLSKGAKAAGTKKIQKKGRGK